MQKGVKTYFQISTQAMGRQKRKASPESSQSATLAKIQNTVDVYQTGEASNSTIANLPDPVVNFPDCQLFAFDFLNITPTLDATRLLSRTRLQGD
jgi:hypothetical protein